MISPRGISDRADRCPTAIPPTCSPQSSYSSQSIRQFHLFETGGDVLCKRGPRESHGEEEARTQDGFPGWLLSYPAVSMRRNARRRLRPVKGGVVVMLEPVDLV